MTTPVRSWVSGDTGRTERLRALPGCGSRFIPKGEPHTTDALYWAANGCDDCLDLLAQALAPEPKRLFPIQSERGARPHPTRIPWSLADKAYSVYSARYGRDQSLERLAERGGFGPSEMDQFVPDWRDEASELLALRAEVERVAREVVQAWRDYFLSSGGSVLALEKAIQKLDRLSGATPKEEAR